MSPYVYCANNPVVLKDPDGRTVVAEDEQSRNNILNTLTIKEAKCVEFDENGVLNDRRLQRCKSTSENITALKTLSHSDIEYHFLVAEKTHSGTPFSTYNKNGEGYMFNGVTEFPGVSIDPSPDNNVWILTSSLLDGESAAMNTAHEGYGHAFFYELQRQGQDVNPFHDYEFYQKIIYDENGEITGITISCRDANVLLDQQIEKTTLQAKINYNSRKK